MSAPGSVYFVQGVDGGPIKIGVSQNAASRLKDFQSHSPVKLKLLAAVPGNIFDERRIHEELKAHRLHGEWFTDCPEVQAAIVAAKRDALEPGEESFTLDGLSPEETTRLIRLFEKWARAFLSARDVREEAA